MIDRRGFLVGAAGLALRPWQFLDAGPTVRVEQGTLLGRDERELRVFRGIPFARPPLRFRAPEPPAQWFGARRAFDNAPAAMQSGQGDSEDCLYLNIWAPKGEGPFPAYVWIHGGGNVGGGTNSQSGASFARDGVIVVTVAYRLGAFGYLKLDDLLGREYAGSGANGIRDLIAALRWVQRNIAAFGGDPGSVTIGGQSAGAKNVAALVASPEAKGLFARAIMESGSGHTVHTPAQASDVTRALLAALNLQEKDAERLLSLSAKELLDGQHRLLDHYPHNYPFRPATGNSVLSKRPVDLVDNRIPLLIGTNRDEGLSFMDRSSVDRPVESRATSNIPFSAVPELEARYNRAFASLSSLERRIRLISAEEYWMPSVRFAEAHSHRGGKTWMYRFDHTNQEGHVMHGAELDFAWNHHEGWSMHEIWVDFMHGREHSGWPQYDGRDRKTMIFGQDGGMSVVEDPRGDERRLWDGILS
ncbi:MAG: carboxylesterase/lipase family protein [Armatimonadetes bacterium]|nr:carboxylesterase/lipase family protein [Armatimonadota bacterium]